VVAHLDADFAAVVIADGLERARAVADVDEIAPGDPRRLAARRPACDDGDEPIGVAIGSGERSTREPR